MDTGEELKNRKKRLEMAKYWGFYIGKRGYKHMAV